MIRTRAHMRAALSLAAEDRHLRRMIIIIEDQFNAVTLTLTAPSYPLVWLIGEHPSILSGGVRSVFCCYRTACLFFSAMVYLTLIVTARMTNLLIVSLPCAQQMLLISPATPPVLLISPATPPVLLLIPLLRPVAICFSSLSARVPRVLCILLLIIAVLHVLPSICVLRTLCVIQSAVLQGHPP